MAQSTWPANARHALSVGADYNLWAGPASDKPLTRPKFHYDWHWVWNTGNGELGNNNIHSLDICRWGLGVTGLGQSVISYGGRLGYSDAGETPNTQVCVFDFGDKTIVSETRGLKTDAFTLILRVAGSYSEPKALFRAIRSSI